MRFDLAWQLHQLNKWKSVIVRNMTLNLSIHIPDAYADPEKEWEHTHFGVFWPIDTAESKWYFLQFSKFFFNFAAMNTKIEEK